MRAGCLLVLVAGCGFRGAEAPIDIDSGPPPPDACVSFSRELDTCPRALTADLSLTGTVKYDTDLHQLTVDDVAMSVTSMVVSTLHGDVDALLVHDLRLTAATRLRATGALPFAIIASGRVVLEDDAAIDLSDGGAAARAQCDGGATTGQASSDGAGGGGGGGFAGNGGEGGKGNSDSGGVKDGGGRGVAVTAPPVRFVGGCPGAPGGKGDVDGGAGGNAGGAVYIVAADAITLGARAAINAGGGGGGGGGHATNRGDAGGGGGGSGGMIVLEAPVVMSASGALAANGGGGGEGSAEEAGGNPGLAATSSADRAPGGASGVTNGGDGGPGGSSDSLDGAPGLGPRPGGGGGGGGSVGFIRIIAASPQLGIVSPAPGGASAR